MHKLFIPVFAFVFSTHLVLSQSDSLMASGLAKQKVGSYDQAIADFTAAGKKSEAAVQEYVKKWDEGQKYTEFERAEKGIELPPIDIAFARSYYMRGISYAAIKKNEEALADLNTAIKINPKSGEAYLERGKLLWATGKKYEGCCDLRMSIALGDSLAKEVFDEKFCWNEAKLYYEDALLKIKLNQFDQALHRYRKP